MTISQHVDAQVGLQLINEEIKAVTQQWIQARIKVDGITHALSVKENISEDEKKRYDKLKDNADKCQTEKKREYFFKTLSGEDRDLYLKVQKSKNDESILKKAKENLEIYEDYLETANALKSEFKKVCQKNK